MNTAKALEWLYEYGPLLHTQEEQKLARDARIAELEPYAAEMKLLLEERSHENSGAQCLGANRNLVGRALAHLWTQGLVDVRDDARAESQFRNAEEYVASLPPPKPAPDGLELLRPERGAAEDCSHARRFPSGACVRCGAPGPGAT